MAAACFSSFAILAGSLVALYGLDWYRNRKQNRKSTRKVEKEYTTKEPIAGQLA
ncbi:MAG TPA: hypothetical protein VIP56_00460 [Nitrososphaeraceae archaeon]|jgi:hypothetical protein